MVNNGLSLFFLGTMYSSLLVLVGATAADYHKGTNLKRVTLDVSLHSMFNLPRGYCLTHVQA